MDTAAARRWLGLLRTVATPLALLFLCVAAYSARDALAAVLQQARLPALLPLLPLWASLHLLTPLYARVLLRADGAVLPYATALRVHLARLPARYLPGGIWHTVTKATDFSALGVDNRQLFLLVLLENAIPFALALTLGAGALYLGQASPPLLGVLALGACLLLLLPPALHWLPLLRRRGLQLSWPRYALLLLISTAFWSTAALTFALYWQALDAPAHTMLQLGGAYLLSWATGFAAVFAPQGLGVFETSIALLLNDATPLAGLIVLAAGFRALSLLADLLAYTLYLLYRGIDTVRLRRPARAGADSRPEQP